MNTVFQVFGMIRQGIESKSIKCKADVLVTIPRRRRVPALCGRQVAQLSSLSVAVANSTRYED